MDFRSLISISIQENGDKIILPPSILESLIENNVDFPMTFEIVTNQKKTHCGVLEFTADEGTCCIPYWIMKNLEINERDRIYIRNVVLQKASFIKFKTTTFLELSDPRAILEYKLRAYSCVTIGDKLEINYNSRNYILEVIDVKPKKACCIIEADIEVDFEPYEIYKSETNTVISQEASQKTKIKVKNIETSEIVEPIEPVEKIKVTSTKWGKTSKIAHFNGTGNKLN
jgi:ubiquitin fusion degradation protein 1